MKSPLVRHPANPILSAKDIPFDASLIFNAGVCKFNGEYVMLFRDDFGSTREDFAAFNEGRAPFKNFTGTTIGLAHSPDGVHWTPEAKPVFEMHDDEVMRVYDPRLTVVDGKIVLCFAMDTRHGLRGGIATTEDLHHFDIKSLSVPDNRNMVVFPEKIGGKYVRLERPMPIYSRGSGEKFDVWCSSSPDLVYWGESKLVLGGESCPFANAKLGPAAPPIRTKEGWLTTYHAVSFSEANLKGWEKEWHKIYRAGLMLLDLEDPSKVIAMAKEPLIDIEAPYEEDGFRGSVIFPGGMLLEPDGEVKIYYGASDTVECLATAHVDDLVAFCKA